MSWARHRLLQRLSAEIDHPGVLAAVGAVPREAFCPPALTGRAWEESALPIGEGQTLSNPRTVARMLAQVIPPPPAPAPRRALELGAGSGYVAALLSRLCQRVLAVERVPTLARAAQRRLARLGYPVDVLQGDGSLGLPEEGPYDVIVLSAATPLLPDDLLAQLAEGGRLIAPVGTLHTQLLHYATRRGSEVVVEVLVEHPMRFVPLVGRGGFPPRRRDGKRSTG